MTSPAERAAGGLPDWYRPTAGHLWDPWFVVRDDVLHLFHLLQVPPAWLSRDDPFPRDRPVIAHATWAAGSGWTDHGVVVGDTGTAYDAERIHTGCVVEHGGGYLMFYSGSNRAVCLARSPDLETWTKDPDNPVLRPDPRRYLGRWRDPSVVRGATGAGHVLLVAAQRSGPDGEPVGVVAVARSPDLVRWEQEAPLTLPPWFAWWEVPELQEVRGTWYLVFATRGRWITAAGREAFRALGLRPADGAYCLSAPSWRGPYGSLTHLAGAGYTTRLLARSPTEHWLWSHVEQDDAGRTVFGLAPPRRIGVGPDGGLVLG